MANISKHDVMQKFESKVLAEALKKVDIDKAATKIAAHIEKELARSARDFVENNVDFSELFSDIVWDDRSEAGKAFNKAMDSLTTRMVSAFAGELVQLQAPKKNLRITKKKTVKKKAAKRTR